MTQQLEERLASLEVTVNSMKEDMAVVVDVMTTIKAGAKILFAIGVIGKWIAMMTAGVAAIFALVTFFKTGIPPQIHLD